MAAETETPIGVDDQYLSADDILSQDDVQFDDVIIPEWKKHDKPGVVSIQSLSAKDAMDFTEALQGPKRKTAMIDMIVLSAVNRKTRVRLFSERRQVEELAKKNIRAFMRLQKAVLQLNGMGDEAEDAEALKKD